MRISKSIQNKIKLACVLNDKKIRIKEKKIVLEGLNTIDNTISSEVDFDFVLYTKELLKNKHGINILKKCKKNEIECIEISQKNMLTISHINPPPEIIAVVERKEYNLSQLPVNKENCFLVILDSIKDSVNVGMIIRIAEAFNAQGIITSKGCIDIYNPKTIRSTGGAIFHIPVVKVQNLKETIKLLKSKGIKILATDINGKENYLKYKFTGKIALLIGNEACGLKSDFTSQADTTIKIPVFGKIQTLSAACAFNIIISERVRQNFKYFEKLKLQN